MLAQTRFGRGASSARSNACGGSSTNFRTGPLDSIQFRKIFELSDREESFFIARTFPHSHRIKGANSSALRCFSLWAARVRRSKPRRISDVRHALVTLTSRASIILSTCYSFDRWSGDTTDQSLEQVGDRGRPRDEPSGKKN